MGRSNVSEIHLNLFFLRSVLEALSFIIVENSIDDLFRFVEHLHELKVGGVDFSLFYEGVLKPIKESPAKMVDVPE